MIIGTAGHIDHGKSALVTALTGRPVDRLIEEQRRGITIELNFAPLEFPGLDPVGIIDVPGHEDLVRTMVAGATGIDLVLFVVDLTEGPRAQTFEHLAIVEQLRIPVGIPVFTKADIADPEWAELVIAEVTERLSKSIVKFEAPAVVSAVTGQGIEELRGRLEKIARSAASKAQADDWFRMPVDRVFAVAGVGTVVTGTTWTGRVAIGDHVTIQPGKRVARVRSVQAYGRNLNKASRAVRTALGLTGVDRDEVHRGDSVLVGNWEETTALDAKIELLETAPRPIRLRSRVRVHIGTSEVIARCHPQGTLEPGHTAIVRLALESPTVARAGDRLVLRTYSPTITIGGGVVVDPLPPRKAAVPPGASSDDPATRLAALVERRRFGILAPMLPQIAGAPPGEAAALAKKAGLVEVASRFLTKSEIDRLIDAGRGLIKEFHKSNPTEQGIPLQTLRQQLKAPDGLVEEAVNLMAKNGSVVVREGIARLRDFTPVVPEGRETAVRRLIDALTAAGLNLLTVDEITAAVGVSPIWPILRQAVDQGMVAAIDRDRYAARSALDKFIEELKAIGRNEPITPAAVRDRLGLTRKNMIPLLEWTDRQGVTRREGDVRTIIQSGR